jgi:hypothetical protein
MHTYPKGKKKLLRITALFEHARRERGELKPSTRTRDQEIVFIPQEKKAEHVD